MAKDSKSDKAKDEALGMNRPIDRRQFCQGVSVGLGASLMGFAGDAWAMDAPFAGSPEVNAAYYPPAKLGLRGSHPGAFENAHALVHEGKHWDTAADTGEGVYDLVVVGSGISGLSAAYFFRKARPDAKILILENHDDFGGHAKRNEFKTDKRMLIGYGGSQSIDTPASYSPAAAKLIEELGIKVEKFYQDYDQQFYNKKRLGAGVYLDADSYGHEVMAVGDPSSWLTDNADMDEVNRFVAELTDNEADRASLVKIMTSTEDFLADMTGPEKVKYLRSISYEQYLRRHFGASDFVISLYQRRPKAIWGVGADAITARAAMRLGYVPGFNGIKIDEEHDDPYRKPEPEQPYIFHFPDGNASVARLLVRALIPDAAPGHTMEDIVTARFNYPALDRAGQDTKIRLSATVVNIRHEGDVKTAKEAVVRYVKADKAWDVRARHVIFAGYGNILPYLVPELPEKQKEAIRLGTKVPLVYTNVLIRNRQAFDKLGLRAIHFPSGFFDWAELDFPVSIGAYDFPKGDDEPILVHMSCVPDGPKDGSDCRAQLRAARYALLGKPFEDYERAIREQLGGALKDGGFDPAEDILAITVNRWPHGYAYEYNDLYDPPEWNPHNGPHLLARAGYGRISMAGSDMAAFAYVNGAIDAAWHAINERLKV
ncbi:NAD(P)-binding protein [Kordiimonas marina]|uniref:NAD(P)-binding protein n=1 Tax=Kordiimonas marina TaxID=2872312 RepID=UPI001FF6710D|nr:NAD(P)-binding protein [Kordiimonas marina]MCJ9430144.1 NAD(P)-binding protein [Kordiimonas marina]